MATAWFEQVEPWKAILSDHTTVPAEVDVRVVGMPSLVGALRPEQLVPLVDLKSAGLDGQRSGAAPVPVTVSLEGCTVHVLPSTVVVKW